MLSVSTPLASLKVHVNVPSTLVQTPALADHPAPATVKLVPKDLVATSTKVQEPEAAVTAEVSMVKSPSNVAVPAPVILLLDVPAMTNINPALSARTSVPALTVVSPV